MGSRPAGLCRRYRDFRAHELAAALVVTLRESRNSAPRDALVVERPRRTARVPEPWNKGTVKKTPVCAHPNRDRKLSRPTPRATSENLGPGLLGLREPAQILLSLQFINLSKVSACSRSHFDKARAMIEQAEALGEQIEDPLLLYSVLYGFFIAKFIPFEGESACALASQFLELARQQKVAALIMIGHRLLDTFGRTSRRAEAS
jgi:hypothetical protein